MVTISNLCFGYKDEALFNGLNLRLEPGNMYGFLGVNGAGKTSLLRIISGQLFAASGGVTVMGEDPKERSPGMLRNIFFLPEEFNTPRVRPLEYASIYGAFYPDFDKTTLEQYAAEFALPLQKYLTEYSYGQKKKFLISFGLASGAKLLLLDEPTNGLDIPSKGRLRRTLASALSEEKTFVISTHQVRDLTNLIDPVIIVDKGKIIFKAGMEETARQLSVEKREQEPHDPDILYFERDLSGYTAVRKNTGGGESLTDLELLFNAVTTNPSQFQVLFEKEHANEAE